MRLLICSLFSEFLKICFQSNGLYATLVTIFQKYARKLLHFVNVRVLSFKSTCDRISKETSSHYHLFGMLTLQGSNLSETILMVLISRQNYFLFSRKGIFGNSGFKMIIETVLFRAEIKTKFCWSHLILC